VLRTKDRRRRYRGASERSSEGAEAPQSQPKNEEAPDSREPEASSFAERAGFEPGKKEAAIVEEKAVPSIGPTDSKSESARASEPLAAAPLTLDVLRAKLDRAIVAEAWDAVKAIRERIVALEREGVVELDEERKRRRSE
jgi:hypothetical protein